MAKEIVTISNLGGGLNTFANPRQIEDSQLVVADNVDTSVEGQSGVVGGFSDYTNVSSGSVIKDAPVKEGGYGLFTYKVDHKLNAPATSAEVSVIANYEDIGSSERIGFLQEESNGTITEVTNLVDLTANGCARNSGDTTAGSANDTTQVQYLVADGELCISGVSKDGLEATGSFDPQVLRYIEAGQVFFANSGNLTESTTGASWQQKKFFAKAPLGGAVYEASNNNVVTGITGLDWSINDDKVGVVALPYSQTSRSHQGWSSNSDGSSSQKYTFYGSYVYSNGAESMATSLGTLNLGGNKDSGDKFNDYTFYAFIRARSNSTSGALQHDLQIIAVNIYYVKEGQDDDVKYLIGEYPIRNFNASEYLCEEFSSSSNGGFILLYGNKSGKGNSSFVGKGVYHYQPPRTMTHAVNSGIRGKTKSTEVRFKTGVILNRKLYVGNISQITNESPSTRKSYPDRLLKSIANRYNVLPDTEFVDVAIRDGEDIIKLAGIGNMLLQYKQNTLYVISVAGGEEYLAGTYKNMGVRHPNAVVQFEGGVFWVNEFGAYVFSGGEAPINLIEKKIDLAEWAGFISDESIVGYNASQKQLWVCGNANEILDDDSDGDNEPTEFYVFNMQTASWNKHIKTVGERVFTNGVYGGSDQGYDSISNFINYIKPDGRQYMMTAVGKGTGSNNGAIKYYNQNKDFHIPFKLSTKEYTAGNAHQRKSIYAVYVTYKGAIDGDDNSISGGSYIYPAVKVLTQNAGNTTSSVTLEPKSAGLGFTTATDWETAHFVVPQAQKVNVRNAYSIQIVIEPASDSSSIKNNFKISDISIIFRLKSVK